MSPDGSPPTTDRLRRVLAGLISAAVFVATVAALAYVTRQYYVYPRTDDAYVRANTIGVAPHVSGPIIELPVVDNQYVRAGQVLFVVDPRPYQADGSRHFIGCVLVSRRCALLQSGDRLLDETHDFTAGVS